jgi:hypothetical protein
MTMRLVLAMLAVAAAACPAAAARPDARDPWASLRRPLHLPKLASGAACPQSHVNRRVRWRGINIFGGQGLGRGPVYPALPSAFFMAARDRQYGGPWFGTKVFWYVQPSYRGPVLIRGRRLDGPQRMGFNGRRVANPELRIKRGETVSWEGQPAGSRGVPSGVRVLAAGCYGIQIDGTSFSRVVVVSADVAD